MSVVSASLRSRVRSTIERPVAGFFGRLGFSPNALTLVGFGIAILGAYFAATQAWLIAGLVVGFGAIFDLFDGALARATGKTSTFGAFLDSTLDRAGEGVVYVGIVWGLALPVPPFETYVWAGGPMLAAAALVSGYMVSYVRARSEGLGFSAGTGMASVGIAPREVRMVILVIGLIFANAVGGYYFMGFGPVVLNLALFLITVLSTITTIQRILFTYRQSKTQEVSR
jgi:CDP-diacylglycerol--glycerol-3-phosphate 3-phosphatidyltransferase